MTCRLCNLARSGAGFDIQVSMSHMDRTVPLFDFSFFFPFSASLPCVSYLRFILFLFLSLFSDIYLNAEPTAVLMSNSFCSFPLQVNCDSVLVEPSMEIAPTVTANEPSHSPVAMTSRKPQAPCPICGLLLGVRSLSAHLKFRHGEAKRPPKKNTFKACSECDKKIRTDDMKVGGF